MRSIGGTSEARQGDDLNEFESRKAIPFHLIITAAGASRVADEIPTNTS